MPINAKAERNDFNSLNTSSREQNNAALESQNAAAEELNGLKAIIETLLKEKAKMKTDIALNTTIMTSLTNRVQSQQCELDLELKTSCNLKMENDGLRLDGVRLSDEIKVLKNASQAKG